MTPPVVFDLFCGLGGWSEAFIAAGYRAVGFDIEAHDYGSGGYPGELVLRDIRSITGAELVKQYGVPAVIVASPPCQEFSYMAMPWSKAKEKMRNILADDREKVRLCALFNECFRIQREVSQAAGRYVPMIVENVRGAQKWVGKAMWHYGSFYLWGDVPALMPITKSIHKRPKPGTGNQLCAVRLDQIEGFKSTGMNWCNRELRGQDFTRVAGRQAAEQGPKVGKDWFGGYGGGFGWDCSPMRRNNSKINARKAASAQIAKIPRPLAEWIAKCFKSALILGLAFIIGCASPAPSVPTPNPGGASLSRPTTKLALAKAVAVPPPAGVGSVTVAWDPSPDPRVTGYRVYWGLASHGYDWGLVTFATSAAIHALQPGTTYYFAARCFTATHLQSDFSNEVSYRIPAGGPATGNGK